MSVFDLLTMFGGLAMFLYGMRLMGDGLKESSSGTLKLAMESVTNNPVKAFFLGLVITAVIQSSTATIVITRTAVIKPLNLARKLFMWPVVRPVVLPLASVLKGVAILDTQNTSFRSLI